ncbi:glycosyltransferase [Gramella jeungdoensis]|uniref:Glycosyltransferase n=1 Tax=Gramella jeungdoensis TaxID=708091 RepID=A0ABT0YZ71_9FLAO|nr:glycosyltransferase [Gramella jeungdoensis]MCM8568758.1 glycosyltransferase [Gramella jeungdoensis]
MQKKLKILVSAYACSPDRGSEPGMGWNFVLGLSKYHEVHVISEKKKWKKPVEDFLSKNPEISKNLNFYFIHKKRNKKLRKIWPPSYYWFYREWQKRAFKLAQNLEEVEKFDLIHQLNMVGYREPGYLWKINKPFVWGPIGGMENSPWNFLPSLGLKGMCFYAGRNLINLWQRNNAIRPKKAAKRESVKLIAATQSNKTLIGKIWKKNSIVIPEVGKMEDDLFQPHFRSTSDETLEIVWSGQHTAGKNLPLLLNALKNSSLNYRLHVLGTGEMTKRWKVLAGNLNIKSKWYGWLEKSKAIDIMKTGHVFCITSISDLTSTVTLEALSYALPVVALDHCGFSNIIDESCGIKIPVKKPRESRLYLKEALETLGKDENLRQKLSLGASRRAQDFKWDNKIEKLNSIYSELI